MNLRFLANKSVTSCHFHLTKNLLFIPLLLILTACTVEPGSTLDPQQTQLKSAPPIVESERSQPGSSLARIKERGTLIVGTSITKPFEFHDPETDKLVGFDVDTAQHIADSLGVQLKWVEMPFANLIPALEEQKVDMTIAAMYITPERQNLVDFAIPYIDTGLVIVARPEIKDSVQSVQDLNGLKVGVKIGATGARFAQDLIDQGIALEIKEYKNTLDSLLDLEVGRIDVVLNDHLNTLAYLKDAQSDLTIITHANGDAILLSEAALGIAVNKENQDLLKAVNDTLSAMKKDGTFDQFYQTWLAPSTDK